MRSARAPVFVLVAACAHSSHFATREHGKVTLAVLATEAQVDPRLLHTLDDALQALPVKGIERTFVSKASLEVVQLSIGCVDYTPKCYTAVARSLAADHILFARVLPADPKKKRSLRITVVLFDAGRGGVTGEISRTFASEDDAIRDVGKVVEAVVTHPEAPEPRVDS